MPIYEQRLQQDLNKIRDMVMTMGDGVETALRNALQALFTGNEVLANMTILHDYTADKHCRDLDHDCHTFIARHLPSAGHLRMISSTMRMIYDLERIADYAVTICRESLDLSSPPSGILKEEIAALANKSQTMLRQALTAFADGSIDLARATIEMNVQLGTVLETAFRDLIAQGDAESGHSREVMDLYVIFTLLERVGNRATNLCEEILFWLTGETPQEKPVNILFLDEENNALSLMAEAIAKKGYDKQCRFISAGRSPASTPYEATVTFMRTIGFDLSRAQPKGLATIDINTIDIVIGLQGPVRSYIPQLPFHTVFLNWDVGTLPDPTDKANEKRRFEEIYRELAVQLRQLIDIISGKEGV